MEANTPMDEQKKDGSKDYIAAEPLPYLGVDEKQVDVEPKLHWRTWMTLLACIVIWSGIVLGISATGFWLERTLTKIGGKVPGIGLWFAEGSIVVQVGLTPIFGLISDFSPSIRKLLTISLTLVGAIGLFVAGSAQHLVSQGLVGACFIGIAFIALGPSAAIVADIFPRRMRGIAQGFLSAVGGGGGAFLGVVAGGAIVKHVNQNNGWRWNLYLAGILEITGCFLLFIVYRPLPVTSQKNDAPSYWHRIAHFDWIGSILFCSATVPIMIALVWGNSTYPWSSTPCVVTITLGFAILVVFILHQVFIKKDGVFNHQLFRNRNFAICLIAIFIEGFAYTTWNIYLAEQIGTLYSSDPLLLGLHLGVLVLGVSTGSIVWGFYTKRFREVKLPLVFGFVGLTASAIGFSQLHAFGRSSARAAWGLCALMGFSFGGPESLIVAVIQLSVTPELTGIATSLGLLIRSLGSAIGSAISNAIFAAKISTFLPQQVALRASEAGVSIDQLPSVIEAMAKGGLRVMNIPGISASQLQAARIGYMEASAHAYSYIHYSIIPWTAAAALVLFALKSVKNDMNWQIDRSVEKDLVEDSHDK